MKKSLPRREIAAGLAPTKRQDRTMKRLMLLVMFLVLIISYRPVIKKDLMDAGIRQFTFADLVKNPDL